jgi:hypothetical protein
MKTRENLAFVLADEQRGVTDSPGAFLALFREYRQRFDAFGRGGPSPAAPGGSDVALVE